MAINSPFFGDFFLSEIKYHCKCDCGRRYLCDNECEYVGDQVGSYEDPFLCLCKRCVKTQPEEKGFSKTKECRTEEEREKVQFS